MTSTQLKQPFHDHLDECDQCRNSPMELCAVGHNLLTNRTYDTPKQTETAYCFTCQKVKPKDQVVVREVENIDGHKSHVSRCIPCWDRRGK